MAYKNFIPEIWAEAINRDLERLHVFADGTNRQYEGEVSQKGDSIRILGVGKPTITSTTKDGFTKLGEAETVEDTSITMKIDQMAYFNYKVDDIDKRQSVGEVHLQCHTRIEIPSQGEGPHHTTTREWSTIYIAQVIAHS